MIEEVRVKQYGAVAITDPHAGDRKVTVEGTDDKNELFLSVKGETAGGYYLRVKDLYDALELIGVEAEDESE